MNLTLHNIVQKPMEFAFVSYSFVYLWNMFKV